MPKFSKKLDTIATAEASQLLGRAKDLQREGKEVTILSVGEPDFDTHDSVKEAAKVAIDAGNTKYAPLQGIFEVREAICVKLKRDNGIEYDPSNIITSTGAKQVIFNAMMATLDAGDEVILPAPYWAGYSDSIRLCGGELVFVETSEDDDYLLTPSALKAAITTQTTWLVLNNPSNPSGAVYSREHLEGLAEVLRSHPNIWIMCDDIYEHLIYDDTEFFTLAQVAPDLKDRVLIVNGCSKSYAMTGWRLGFGAGDKDLIEKMINVQSQVTLAPSTISQWAAVTALNEDYSIQGDELEKLRMRRDLAVAKMNECLGLSCKVPAGAFYIYVNCSGVLNKTTPSGKLIENDRDFATYLLEEAGAAVMPGVAYGLSPYLRLSYGIETSDLESACSRIKKACAQLT